MVSIGAGGGFPLALGTALPLVLAAGIPLAIASVVRHDARKQGVNRPDLWAAVTFLTAAAGTAVYVVGGNVQGALLTGVLGPIVYLLERDDPDRRGSPDDGEFVLPGGPPETHEAGGGGAPGEDDDGPGNDDADAGDRAG